jgi:hypothetical protein
MICFSGVALASVDEVLWYIIDEKYKPLSILEQVNMRQAQHFK